MNLIDAIDAAIRGERIATIGNRRVAVWTSGGLYWCHPDGSPAYAVNIDKELVECEWCVVTTPPRTPEDHASQAFAMPMGQPVPPLPDSIAAKLRKMADDKRRKGCVLITEADFIEEKANRVESLLPLEYEQTVVESLEMLRMHRYENYL